MQGGSLLFPPLKEAPSPHFDMKFSLQLHAAQISPHSLLLSPIFSLVILLQYLQPLLDNKSEALEDLLVFFLVLLGALLATLVWYFFS
jgi:hypothetical protein